MKEQLNGASFLKKTNNVFFCTEEQQAKQQLQAQQQQQQLEQQQQQSYMPSGNLIGLQLPDENGEVLYLDPNDPAAQILLQEAGIVKESPKGVFFSRIFLKVLCYCLVTCS